MGKGPSIFKRFTYVKKEICLVSKDQILEIVRNFWAF